MTLQFPGQMLRQAVPEISTLTCSPTPSFFLSCRLRPLRADKALPFQILSSPTHGWIDTCRPAVRPPMTHAFARWRGMCRIVAAPIRRRVAGCADGYRFAKSEGESIPANAANSLKTIGFRDFAGDLIAGAFTFDSSRRLNRRSNLPAMMIATG